jgi:hypothetical protein
MPVYAAERAAGLADALRAGGRLVLACETTPLVTPAAPPPDARRPARALAAAPGQIDLFYLQSVLCQTGWNKNDDVFDPAEVWDARATPVDKPFNYEHEQPDIIGHITGCRAEAQDGSPLPDDTPAEEVPAAFRLVTPAVVYRLWEDPALQERIDRVIAEIGEGKWYVSMECHFFGFDYAVTDGESQKVVARNKNTAFLTKHLRAYGGDGRYQGMRVGRLMRRIVFAGKGLVRKPANPGSVILSASDVTPFGSAAAAEILSVVPEKPVVENFHPRNPGFVNGVGYGTSDASVVEPTQEKPGMSEPIRADDPEALKAENERLKAALKQIDEARLQKQAAELDAVRKEAEEARAALKAKAEEATQLASRLADAEKDAATVRAALAAAEAERRRGVRAAAVTAALGLEAEKAAELANNLDALDDAAFAAVLKTQAEAMDAKMAAYQAVTTTPPPAAAAPIPPASPKTPPTVSTAAAPMAGAPTKVMTMGAGGAAVPPATTTTKVMAAAVDQAVPEPAPALAVVPPVPDAALQKARADVAAFFGVEVATTAAE